MTDRDWKKRIKESSGAEKNVTISAYSDWLEDHDRIADACVQRERIGLGELRYVLLHRPTGTQRFRYRRLGDLKLKVKSLLIRVQGVIYVKDDDRRWVDGPSRPASEFDIVRVWIPKPAVIDVAEGEMARLRGYW